MTTTPLHHPQEPDSNTVRSQLAQVEPKALRTFTPSQAVLARSAGAYHWTPEGRRLYDFTSGVLVSNLGHNPVSWMRRFCRYMGWPADPSQVIAEPSANGAAGAGYFPALPLTAYNALTAIEVEASRRLAETLQKT